MIKIFLSKYKYLPVYLLVLFIFNLLLLMLPLTRVFGFEFSALNALVVSFLSGLYSISVLKKIEKDSGVSFVRQVARAYFLFLIIPLAVSLLHSIFTTSCSFWDGVAFYAVLTLPSVIIGGALGIIITLVSNKFRVLLFILLFIIILLIPLIEFYVNPQIYFYNPLFGYYPGTIYDEGLSVSLKLAGYRLLNLLFFGFIYYTGLKIKLNKSSSGKSGFLVISAVLPLLFLYFSPAFGYSTSFLKLSSELNKKIITNHFIIHYSPGIDESTTKSIALLHEYYYYSLTGFFEEHPDKKINSFLFLNSEQKKKLFGTANADVAKPWLYQTYTVYDNYNSTLKHEIAHCFTAPFGTGIFKVAHNINPSLIEGAAVAADPIYDENNVDFMAALAYENGYKISLKNLYSGFNFLVNSSSISYIYAGSFSRFLIRNYGIKKFKKLYADADFDKVYGKPLDSLSGAYFSYLSRFDAADQKDMANYYFGRKSIFYKVCPRYVADRLNEGWNQYYSKDYNSSISTFRQILETTNNYSAITGYASSLQKTGKDDESIKFLKDRIGEFKNSAYYYNLELRLADFYAIKGNYKSADSLYTRLVLQNPNRVLFYIANLRKDLMNKDRMLNIYLTGNEFDKYVILRELNNSKFYFNTFPVLINLSKSINENFSLFLSQFKGTLRVNNYASAYAVFKLSNYMLENMDIVRARKTAALAKRYDGDLNFRFILNDNFDKMNWIFSNKTELLNSFKYAGPEQFDEH